MTKFVVLKNTSVMIPSDPVRPSLTFMDWL